MEFSHTGTSDENGTGMEFKGMENNVENESDDLTVIEQQAFSLAQAGIQLDQARSADRGNPAHLAGALDNNLQVWVGIGTIVSDPKSGIADNIKTNILRLRDFIVDTTMKNGTEISESMLNTLININLQISEGLLESAKNE